MVRKLAYISSVWDQGGPAALERASSFCRSVYEAGYSPVCPYMMHSGFIRSSDPTERTDSLEMSAELLRRCALVVICGSQDNDEVKRDIAIAQSKGIPTVKLSGIIPLRISRSSKG